MFSDESIAARLQALDQLSNYTELLYQLANSDAPASIKAKASDLQTSLTNLSGEVNKLTGASDAGFKSAVGKVFSILGEVLQAFVNQKIEAAIKGFHKIASIAVKMALFAPMPRRVKRAR